MLWRIAEAAGEGADAASIARSADAPPEFAALTPEILAELNLSAAAWFGAHVQEAA
jgi:EAL and modified HD-GYP domain-containing signal transduction protein